MRRVLALQEAALHSDVPISVHEARSLHSSKVATVSPGQVTGTYDIRVGNVVGTMSLGDLQITIQPKLPVQTVMWLLSESGVDPRWREEVAALASTDIVEVLTRLYMRELDLIFQRGLSSGYRQLETADVVLRGRLRLHEQIGRRFGLLYPLEIQYEEFDRNTPENRTLLSAALVLEHILRDGGSSLATDVSRRMPLFAGVDALTAGGFRPPTRLSRLNEHYADALAIAGLILDGVGLSEEYGAHAGRGIIFPMWKVFERFVARVLTRHVEDRTVDAQYSTRLFVDGRPSVQLRPDIVISRGSSITDVIDTKYKNADPSSADLHQMCAYAAVLGVTDVTLLYAERIQSQTLTIAGSGVRVHLKGVDLNEEPEEILRAVLAARD